MSSDLKEKYISECFDLKKKYSSLYITVEDIKNKVNGFIDLAVENYHNSHSKIDVKEFVEFNFDTFFELYLEKFNYSKESVKLPEDNFLKLYLDDARSNDPELKKSSVKAFVEFYENIKNEAVLKFSFIPGIEKLASDFLYYAVNKYVNNIDKYDVDIFTYLNDSFSSVFVRYIEDRKIDVRKDGDYVVNLLDRYYSGDVKVKALLVEKFMPLALSILTDDLGFSDQSSRDAAMLSLVELIDIYLDKKPNYALSIYLTQRLHNRMYRKIHNLSEDSDISEIPDGLYYANNDNDVEEYMANLYNGSSYINRVRSRNNKKM